MQTQKRFSLLIGALALLAAAALFVGSEPVLGALQARPLDWPRGLQAQDAAAGLDMGETAARLQRHAAVPPDGELELDDMRRRGFEPGSVWLERTLGQPTPEEALALGLSLRDRVMRASRVRTVLVADTSNHANQPGTVRRMTPRTGTTATPPSTV